MSTAAQRGRSLPLRRDHHDGRDAPKAHKANKSPDPKHRRPRTTLRKRSPRRVVIASTDPSVLVRPSDRPRAPRPPRRSIRERVTHLSRAALHDLGSHPAIQAGGATGAVVFFVLFRTGMFLASGDVAPLLTDGLQRELGWQWTHQNSGAGGPTYEIARAVEVLAVQLARALGGTGALGERLLFTCIWAFAAAAGAALAARFTTSARLAALLGVTVALNPYTLIAQPNPLPLITLGVAAAVTTLCIDAARGARSRPIALALLTVPCSYVSLNPPLLALLAAVVVVQPLVAPLLADSRRGGTRRVVSLLVRSLPLSVALGVWWAVPAAIAIRHADPGTVGAVTDVSAWSWTHARSSIPNVVSLFGHWSWPRPEYYGGAVALERFPWAPLRWVLPFLAVSAPFASNRRERRPGLVVVALIGAAALVAKGVHEPFTSANLWLYAHIPGFWLFREPAAKFSVVLVIAYVIGAATTLDALNSRLGERAASGRRRWRNAAPRAFTAIATLPLLGVWPMWTGTMIKGASADHAPDRSRLPGDWRKVASYVNSSALHGKVLALPIDDYYQVPTTWGFYGADNLLRRLLTRPVIQSNPQLYVGDSGTFEALMHTAEQAIAINGGQGTISLLQALGVSHVVVRKDVDIDSPIRKVNMQRPAALIAGLSRVRGLVRVLSTSVADVYELRDQPGAAVEVLGGIVTTGDVPPAGLGQLRSIVPDGLTLASASDIPGLVAGRALVASNNTTTSSLGLSGRWQVSRYAATAPPFRVHLVGDVLRVEDLVTWKVGTDTELVPRRFDVKVPQMVGADVDGTFLDREDMDAYVRVDAATTAHPWIADPIEGRKGTSALSTPFGPLDCNNYDRTKPDQLGLVAVKVIDATGKSGYHLAAERHSSCLRFDIADVRAGTSYRLRLEGTTMGGAPPRWCVWQDGPNTCVPLASSSDGDTTTTSQVWTVPDGVRAASLYLYADEPRGSRATEVHYAEPVVQRVRAAEPVELPVTPARPALVDMPSDAAWITQSVNATPPTVHPFGGVGDCNRSDGRSLDDAGIRATRLDDGVRLDARTHSACVSAAITGLHGSLRYRLSFEHRTVRGAHARYCVVVPATGNCLVAASLPDSDATWQREDIRLDAPSGGALSALQLYVYGDGVRGGTSTEYRNVRVSVVADELLTMISDGTNARTPPTMWFEQISPARYRVHVRAATAAFVVALSDSWSSDWKVSGVPAGVRVDHLRIDGYRNGWAIDGRGDLDLLLEYVPARYGQAALRISAVGAFVAAVLALREAVRRRRYRPLQ